MRTAPQKPEVSSALLESQRQVTPLGFPDFGKDTFFLEHVALVLVVGKAGIEELDAHVEEQRASGTLGLGLDEHDGFVFGDAEA